MEIAIYFIGLAVFFILFFLYFAKQTDMNVEEILVATIILSAIWFISGVVYIVCVLYQLIDEYTNVFSWLKGLVEKLVGKLRGK